MLEEDTSIPRLPGSKDVRVLSPTSVLLLDPSGRKVSLLCLAENATAWHEQCSIEYFDLLSVLTVALSRAMCRLPSDVHGMYVSSPYSTEDLIGANVLRERRNNKSSYLSLLPEEILKVR